MYSSFDAKNIIITYLHTYGFSYLFYHLVVIHMRNWMNEYCSNRITYTHTQNVPPLFDNNKQWIVKLCWLSFIYVSIYKSIMYSKSLWNLSQTASGNIMFTSTPSFGMIIFPCYFIHHTFDYVKLVLIIIITIFYKILSSKWYIILKVFSTVTNFTTPVQAKFCIILYH